MDVISVMKRIVHNKYYIHTSVKYLHRI